VLRHKDIDSHEEEVCVKEEGGIKGTKVSRETCSDLFFFCSFCRILGLSKHELFETVKSICVTRMY
jgi:hypothetical protein